MHKIKEMLHKDGEDKTTTNTYNSSNTTYHSHNNNNGGNNLLSDRNFQQGHVHHGEQFEHGAGHREGGFAEEFKEKLHLGGDRSYDTYSTTHNHSHLGGNNNERHVYHERESYSGGDLNYRDGVDPTLRRDVADIHRHNGGEFRERVGEQSVVKETIKEVELHKVQPVIHREREQKEIRHVVAPEHRFEVKDTQVHHRERDIDLGTRREASTLETSRALGSAPHIESSREFLGKDRQHQELPARVEEHVSRRVEEHVHPVVYKEVLVPKVTEETQHIYERVREMPVETYEVKGDLNRSRDITCIPAAEREFFARESSRGITGGEGYRREGEFIERGGHNHSHWNNNGGQWTNNNSGLSREIHSQSYQQPIIGHHQNIGGHHLASGALPAGTTTAYDAALCNQCTNNQICSHTSRDAQLMQKMNEKKIVKDEKLADKQQRKLMKQQGAGVRNVNVV